MFRTMSPDLIDRDGNKVVSCFYNFRRAPLTMADSSKMDIAGLNPFRYRCYSYDEQTAFYYRRSRYYAPWLGRFINADGYVSAGQGMNCCNMFIYCENNLVNRLVIADSSCLRQGCSRRSKKCCGI